MENNSIQIFDSNYNNTFSITGNATKVTSMCQLDNGNLVTCSRFVINIWKLTDTSFELAWKNEEANQGTIIALSDNRFVSYMHTLLKMKVWKGEEPYNDTPIKEIECIDDSPKSLMYVKEKD